MATVRELYLVTGVMTFVNVGPTYKFYMDLSCIYSYKHFFFFISSYVNVQDVICLRPEVLTALIRAVLL
jgi:hypothetical protein